MTPEQCRAARAWLNWTQADLAEKAKVGLSTVIEFEHGYRATRIENRTAIQTALERRGIRFVDHGGTLRISFVKPSSTRESEKGRLAPSLRSMISNLFRGLFGYYVEFLRVLVAGDASFFVGSGRKCYLPATNLRPPALLQGWIKSP